MREVKLKQSSKTKIYVATNTLPVCISEYLTYEFEVCIYIYENSFSVVNRILKKSLHSLTNSILKKNV